MKFIIIKPSANTENSL